jgi:hypothetical protein
MQISKYLASFALVTGACMVQPRGPASPPPGPPPGHAGEPAMRERVIEGHVVDAVTHAPIDGAGVDVASPATRGGTITVNTDASGRFRVGDLPPDELHIRCRHEHYEPQSHVMTLRPGVTQINCELRPGH